MYKVFDCVANEHDLRLVALAAVICALSSYTTISLLHHVRRSDARMWWVWLAVSATCPPASGSGRRISSPCWRFRPGRHRLQRRADRTLADRRRSSLTGFGLAIAIMSRRAHAAAWLGGAMVGGGIAAMHYTGMAAFEVPGRIVWDPRPGGGVDCARLRSSAPPRCIVGPARGDAQSGRLLGALLLTAAICGLHFTAMGAASITPDPTVDVSASALPVGAARGRCGARELCRRRSRARRRRDRHARPAAPGARGRPDARPRQCRGRGSAGLRRRHHRYGQRQFRGR